MLDFDVAKTPFGAPRHFFTTLLVTLYEANGVEVGRFGRPRQHSGYGQGKTGFRLSIGHSHGLNFIFTHEFAGRIVERNADFLLFGMEGGVAESQLHFQHSILIVVAHFVGENVIANAHHRHVVEHHIAVDTTHAEHILTFEIRTITPAEHLHGKAVFTGAEIFANVELVVVVGTLSIAHLLTVDPDDGGRIDTPEVEDGAASKPIGRNGESTGVGTDGIDAVVGTVVVEAGSGGNEGRCVAVGVFDIAVDGFVVA